MAVFGQFDGLGLSTYLQRKLQKKGIITGCEMLITRNSDLMRITGLTEAAVLELKEKVGKVYFPHQKCTVKIWKTYTKVYNTGVEKLDILLAKTPFKSGSVWEICGKSGVGKTQLCLTIALNFATKSQGAVLYLDTKCDFSGTRIMEMLRCRNVPNNICGHIMQDILVERTNTAEGLCDVLEQLGLHLSAGVDADADGDNIKLVIIDALPAVFFTYRNETDRLTGKYLLAKLNNLVYQLSKTHHLAFIYVNLLVSIEEEQQITENLDTEQIGEPFEVAAAPLNLADCVRPALGDYWSRAPHLRLSLETPVDSTTITNVRLLKLIRSCYSAVGATCDLHITSAGVS